VKSIPSQRISPSAQPNQKTSLLATEMQIKPAGDPQISLAIVFNTKYS
jgi:hypothetical protein